MTVEPLSFKHRVSLNMKLARHRKGRMSQEELAARLGKPRTRVSDWERGRYQPSEKHLHEIAAVLGQEIHWFYIDHGNAYRDELRWDDKPKRMSIEEKLGLV